MPPRRARTGDLFRSLRCRRLVRLHLDTLAAAYDEVERWNDTVKTRQLAISKLGTQAEETKASFDGRLKQYLRHEKAREWEPCPPPLREPSPPLTPQVRCRADIFRKGTSGKFLLRKRKTHGNDWVLGEVISGWWQRRPINSLWERMSRTSP